MDKARVTLGRRGDGSEDEAHAGSRASALMAIGFCGLLGGFLPLIFQPASTPRYVADTQARVHGVSNDAVTGAITSLKSKQSLDNLVHALDLSHDPDFAPPRPGMLQVVYDILSGGGATLAQSEASVRNRLAQALTITYDGTKGTVWTSVATSEAAKTSRLADMVTALFTDALSNASSSGDPAMEGLRQALNRSEAALSGFQSQAGDEKVAELREFRSQTQALKAQVSKAQVDLEALSLKASQAASMTVDDVLAKPLPDSLEFTGLEYQRQRQVQAKLAVDQLSANLGPRHPRLVAAQAALDDVGRDMQQAIRQLATSLQRQKVEAGRQLADLQSRLDKMRTDTGKADGAERLASLEAAVDEARDNYLKGRQNAANVPTQSASSPLEVLKPPVVKRADLPATLPWAWCIGGAATGLATASAAIVLRRRRLPADEELQPAEVDVDLRWMAEVDLLVDNEAGIEMQEPVHQDAPVVEATVTRTKIPEAANDRSLVDQINDVLMANRNPVAQAKLPPLVAAVMAGGAGTVETKRAPTEPAGPVQLRETQEVFQLRREMAELREKLHSYSERRQSARG